MPGRFLCVRYHFNDGSLQHNANDGASWSAARAISDALTGLDKSLHSSPKRQGRCSFSLSQENDLPRFRHLDYCVVHLS